MLLHHFLSNVIVIKINQFDLFSKKVNVKNNIIDTKG